MVINSTTANFVVVGWTLVVAAGELYVLDLGGHVDFLHFGRRVPFNPAEFLNNPQKTSANCLETAEYK
jgi:hypothetical protein